MNKQNDLYTDFQAGDMSHAKIDLIAEREHNATTLAKSVSLATALDSTNDAVTNYPVGCNMTVVDLATDADVVVTASPAYLMGVYVNVVLSAHAALVKDDSTTKITLPASTAAGTKIDCHSATFATNITMESDDAATGSVTIFWRAV
jgi:hypothetical protein